jgi:hypothetical protein
MAENTTPIQSDDPIGETPEEDINHPRFAPYRYTRLKIAKADVSLDDSVPLFLSGHETQSPENFFAAEQRKATGRLRIVTGVLAASALAIALALVPAGAMRTVIVNAQSSLPGASPAQSGRPPMDPAQLSTRTAERTAPAAKPPLQVHAADSAQAPSSIAATPTREEIAAAYRAAMQSRTTTPAPPRIPAPARRLDPDELASLLKRAKSLLAVADIASARLLLERAADAQEAGAALMLARTYDPAVLGTADARSVTPDPAQARIWYRKAAELGSRDAQLRLAQMQN